MEEKRELNTADIIKEMGDVLRETFRGYLDAQDALKSLPATMPLKQAAEFVGVQPYILRHMIKTGKMKAKKLGGRVMVQREELLKQFIDL